MGVVKKSDGRYIVGKGVTPGNEYKGSMEWRDIFIQLTADGATDESVDKLNFLKDYAIYHSGKGEPVMPPSVAVWISNNGTTTAIEADDISYTDGVYTICGIKYENSAWDYTNAGQRGGGSGGGGGLPSYTSADADKGLFLKRGTKTVVPEQSLTFIEASGIYTAEVNGADFSGLSDNDTVVVTMKTKEAYGGETSTADGIYSASDNTITVNESGIVFTIYTDKAEISGDGASVMASAIDTATASVPSVAPAWVSGGVLPAYTDADERKVLTVVKDTEHLVPKTVVPEQALTVAQGTTYYYATVSDSTIDWNSVSDDDTISLTINGDEYSAGYDATSFDIPAFIALSGGTPVAAIANQIGTITFLTTTSGTYTISATMLLPTVKSAWEQSRLPVEIVYIGQRQLGNSADKAMLDGESGTTLSESDCITKIASLVGKNFIFREGTDASHTDYAGYFAEYDNSIMVYLDTSGGSATLKTVGYLRRSN